MDKGRSAPPVTSNLAGIIADLREAAAADTDHPASALINVAAEVIATLQQQLRPKLNDQGEVVFHVSSGVTTDRRPFVTVQYGESITQMSPTQAREVALNILQGAEAAEGDAILVRFLDLEPPQAAALLVGLRAARAARQHPATPTSSA